MDGGGACSGDWPSTSVLLFEIESSNLNMVRLMKFITLLNLRQQFFAPSHTRDLNARGGHFFYHQPCSTCLLHIYQGFLCIAVPIPHDQSMGIGKQDLVHGKDRICDLWATYTQDDDCQCALLFLDVKSVSTTVGSNRYVLFWKPERRLELYVFVIWKQQYVFAIHRAYLFSDI